MPVPDSMSGMKLILMLVPMVAVMTLACSAETGSGGSGNDSPSSDGSSDGYSLGSPQVSRTTGTVPSRGAIDLPSSIVDPVVEEIAQVAGVAASDVVVVSGEAVTFPNGGLGCPEPGMSYTQVQVDGYKIIAVANGTTYDYRGTGTGTFRRCR